SGGPFLWTRHARSRVLAVDTAGAAGGGTARWCAEHDGYRGSVHRRQVELTPERRELRVVDTVRGPRRAVRLAFHLGPAVTARLEGDRAALTWTRDGEERSAVLDLPGQLSWRAHRGETGPPLGWYSPGFGRKEPATTLVGTGFTGGAEEVVTVLGFRGAGGGHVARTWRHRTAAAVAPLALVLLAAPGCEATPDARPEPTPGPDTPRARA